MLGPKKPGDASRWLSAGRVLKASKDGVFSIKPGGVDMSFSSVSIDSVMPSKLIRSDQESIYWSCIVDASESSISGCLPAVAKFKSLGNVVILDAKQTPIGTYIHGLLQDNLMKWNPPRKATDTVEEDGILSLWRVPNEDVEEFKNGVDIETDVRAMIDKLIAHLPSFKAAKIRSIHEARLHSEGGYEAGIRAALVAGEASDRKAASKKGQSSGAQKESAGGGGEAKKKWESLKVALLETHVGNFKLPFKQRYLELRIDKDTGIPTEAGITQLKLQLRYVPHSLPLAHTQPARPRTARTKGHHMHTRTLSTQCRTVPASRGWPEGMAWHGLWPGALVP